MKAPKIKICGITKSHETYMLKRNDIDYAGIVMFYEKSKRCTDMEQAWQILAYLDSSIKSVAVVVSPTIDQIEIVEKLGFSIIQIHGELSEEVLEKCSLPIWRAYNVSKDGETLLQENQSKIQGYVLDGQIPGQGETFDWSQMKTFDRKDKLLILAGGLTAKNVAEGIRALNPDIVDVSSGVEGEAGKDEDKIHAFAEQVRSAFQ